MPKPPETEQTAGCANTATDSATSEPIATNRLTSRSIRSFVIRNGRLTPAQASAVERLLPEFGLTYSDITVDLRVVFGRDAPIWLEIGFGNGDALIDMASRYPEVDFIGIEVHEPGVGHALLGIEAGGLTNVRVIQHDAMDVLKNMLPASSLMRVLLFFPDPWRKKRHFKRRIVQPEFIQLVTMRLQPEGVLHCATDWSDYASWMLEHLEAADCLVNKAGAGQYHERPEWRTRTRFEKRGERLGHEVYDLLYTRR